MRISIHRDQNNQGGIAIGGGSMSGPLTLYGNPTDPLVASTKQYVDNIPTNMDASDLSTGTLPDSMLGPWNGEIYKVAASRVLDLRSVGMIGTHSKMSVNAKGMVVSGSSLSSSDVPGLNWSKFNLNMPTDLAGYGILDGVSTKGDYLNSPLLLEGDPVSPKEIATKNSVDNQFPIVLGDQLKTGDVIRKASGVTPVGFLKANGAILDKTMYADLYSVISDKFNYSNVFPEKTPWTNQFSFNNGTSVPSGETIVGPGLVEPVYGQGTVVTKNKVYLLGGYSVSLNTKVSLIQMGIINESGVIDSWTLAGDLPTVVYQPSTLRIGNKLYLFGGQTSTLTPTDWVRVYVSEIDNEGILGVWTRLPDLPGIHHHGTVIRSRNKVHLLSYNASNSTPLVAMSADVYWDGAIGPWTVDTGTNGLPLITNSTPYIHASQVNKIFYLRVNSLNYYTTLTPEGNLGSWKRTNVHPPTGSTKNVWWSGSLKGEVFEDGSLGASESNTLILPPGSSPNEVITSSRIYYIGGRTSQNSCSYLPFSGGLNDYTSFFDGSRSELDTVTQYQLPNLGFDTENGKYEHYIKY